MTSPDMTFSKLPMDKKQVKDNSFSVKGYDAGKPIFQFPDYHPQLQTADQDLKYSRKGMMARCRDLVRNNPLAKSALRTSRNGVIGDGWRLSIKPDYKSLGITRDEAVKWASAVENIFNTLATSPNCYFDAARKKTFNQILSVAYNAMFIDGDVLGIMQWKPSAIGLNSCINLVDSTRLDTPSRFENDASVKTGIHIDRYGEPIEYYIENPDYSKGMNGCVSDTDFIAVKARTETGRKIVLHGYAPQFAEQTTGISEISACVTLIKQLAQYMSNENDRMALQASIGFAVHSDEDYQKIADVFQIPEGTDEGLDKYTAWLQNNYNNKADYAKHIRKQLGSDKGAKVVFLLPNEKIETLQSSNTTDTFGSFTTVSQKQFASGAGIDHATMANDFSDTSYSAARLSLAQVFEHYKSQKRILIDSFAMPFVFCVVEEMVELGWLTLPKGVPDFKMAQDFLLRGTFVSSGKPFIDPLKERKAQREALDMGVISKQEICAEEGRDYDDVQEQIAIEQQSEKRLGIYREPKNTQTTPQNTDVKNVKE